MNEALGKVEVIEEPCNFAFKNGEYVEVKQEEIEQKPEKLLEKEIKTNPIDFFGIIKSDEELFEDVEPEKVSSEARTLKCKICQKGMPRKLLRLVKSEDDKAVLSDFFKVGGSIETWVSYVCVSHIQTIIDTNDGKLKFASTPFEQLLHSFIRRNKKTIKDSKSQRRNCQICHKLQEFSGLYRTSSRMIRIVLMVGCILRGTHSVQQAISCITSKTGVICYSHCKKSIDEIFEHLGVSSIEEFLKCPTLMMDNIMDIVMSIDPNFTVVQFMDAFRRLFLTNQKFHNNL
ncbi:unnamed protein product [Caenorhabditis nigoni]